MKKNKISRFFISLLSAISVYVAFFYNFQNAYSFIYQLNIKKVIFVIILFMFYLLFCYKEKFENHNIVSSLLFSVFMYCGACYENIGTIFDTNLPIILIIAYLLGWFLLFINIISLLEKFQKVVSKINNNKFEMCFRNFNNTEFILICMFIMIVFWSPYVVLRYPAGIESDAKVQIAQALGFQKLTNRWPVFSSILFGSFFSFGKVLFNSYDFGAILLVLFQTCFSAFVLSYTLLFIKKNGGNTHSILLCLGVYSIVPLFPGYITSIVKDTLFADMVVLFNVFIIESLNEKFSRVKNIIFIIVSILMCLLRNNGIYIVVFETLGIFIYSYVSKSNTKNTIIYLLVAIIFYEIYQKLVIVKMGLYCDNTVEALSIPLQQTARCLVQHYDEISLHDLDIINKVLDISAVKEKYNPLLSDPVKEAFHGDSISLINYLGVWFKMFFKYPKTCIDATLNNIYGFFYPFARMWNRPNCGFYTSNDILGKNLLTNYESIKVYTNLFEQKYINTLETLPISRFICSAAFWVYINIYIFIKSIIKSRFKNIIYMIPSITTILVCVAGPTFVQNGVRYVLPLIFTSISLFYKNNAY